MDEAEEDQEVAAVTDAEVAAAEETVTALFGWTNMDHQPERIIVLLLRTFQAE